MSPKYSSCYYLYKGHNSHDLIKVSELFKYDPVQEERKDITINGSNNLYWFCILTPFDVYYKNNQLILYIKKELKSKNLVNTRFMTSFTIIINLIMIRD